MIRLTIVESDGYKEVILTENNVNITTGILDESGVMDLVRELICATENLLPESMMQRKKALIKIREDLQKS